MAVSSSRRCMSVSGRGNQSDGRPGASHRNSHALIQSDICRGYASLHHDLLNLSGETNVAAGSAVGIKKGALVTRKFLNITKNAVIPICRS